MNARLELLDRRLDASLAAVATNDELAEVARTVASEIEGMRTTVAKRGAMSPDDLEPARRVAQSATERRQAQATPESDAAPTAGDVGHEIDEALARMQADCARTLEHAGLAPDVVSMILTLVNVTADARSAKQQITLKQRALQQSDAMATAPARRAAAEEDPLEPLSAFDIGARLALHERTVRTRERDGKLFSILRAGRRRGQEFPAFQAWPGVAGQPLERALEALMPNGGAAPVSGPQAYGFFTSPTYLLGELAPLEVLFGRALSERGLSAAAQAALALNAAERVELVVKTARTIAAASMQ